MTKTTIQTLIEIRFRKERLQIFLGFFTFCMKTVIAAGHRCITHASLLVALIKGRQKKQF